MKGGPSMVDILRLEVDRELLQLVGGNDLMRLAEGMRMPMVGVQVMLHMALTGQDSLEASVIAQEFHDQYIASVTKQSICTKLGIFSVHKGCCEYLT